MVVVMETGVEEECEGDVDSWGESVEDRGDNGDR